jgi:hypothetical protein
MENTFDLKKFLVENRLTNNSRLLLEGEDALKDLEAKAEKLVDSPQIQKIVQDLLGKLSDKEKDTILKITSGVNENIEESKLVRIVDKLLDMQEGYGDSPHTDQSGGNPLSKLGLGAAYVAVSLGFIKGILLGGGTAALAVVGAPVATVVAAGILLAVAEQLIVRAKEKRRKQGTGNTGQGVNIDDSEAEWLKIIKDRKNKK